MTYNAYYLAGPDGIVAGPFSSVDAAVHGKSKFNFPFSSLLTVVKSSIQAEAV